ncbi:MAG: hypothetical protein K2X80_16920 [Pseudomonadaceae bacterium]|nr:hypothetical protein [Pseudomonadaceae bacterium]
MSKQNTQAIQTSVAAALLNTVIIILPLGLASFLLSGEWLRAKRIGLMALLVIPLAFWLRRYLYRGQARSVLFAMSLLIWACVSLLLFSAGTIINPNLAILIGISVIGTLAHERLLAWLMPLLCITSIVAVATLEHYELLPRKLAPSGFSLMIGSLLAIVFLLLLTRISSNHLAHSQQQQHENTQRLQQLSAQLQLTLEAGNIICFSLDPVHLKLQVGAETSELLQCAAGEQPLQELHALSPTDRQRITDACQQVLGGADFPSLSCQLHSGPGKNR